MDQATELLLQGHQFKKLYERFITNIREKYDLKKIDVDILYFLRNSHEHNTSKDINALNFLNKGQISQSVYNLQQKGLIKAIPDESDRRCMHLMLSEDGYRVVQNVSDAKKKLYMAIFADITEDEKEVLAGIARKIKNNIEKSLSEQM